eukprot:CAMPEP_0170441918 /NCGR_PEP_ID=MMETSP0117_2-20130122/47147_1 /TAXON_ID=400756 /ORGANISM="Durinskia baltica, Strain CSIRO CS-38" /LENGTH=107 /DNA_ID=CAMNT_0010702485 /DNA_START=57 /DNA_END=380 /DNA_ORIENTATION=+
MTSVPRVAGPDRTNKASKRHGISEPMCLLQQRSPIIAAQQVHPREVAGIQWFGGHRLLRGRGKCAAAVPAATVHHAILCANRHDRNRSHGQSEQKEACPLMYALRRI